MSEQVEESRNWFRQSAEDFHAAQGIFTDTVTAEKRALECALFCGDPGFQYATAHQIRSREAKRIPLEYPYAMFLKYCILGEDTEAAKYAEATSSVNVYMVKKLGGYGTLGPACLALANQEEEAFSYESKRQRQTIDIWRCLFMFSKGLSRRPSSGLPSHGSE